MSQSKRKRRWILLALLLLIGVSYGSYRAFGTNPELERVKEIRQELASKDLTPEQRREAFRRLREAMEKLSAEQRRAMAAEGRKRFEEQLKQYAQMSAQEKVRYLDEQIKRSEERRRKQAEAGQGAGGARGGPSSTPAGANGASDPDRPAPSAADRELRRKERLDETTPEFRAGMDQYRKDMAARRAQLGLPPSTRR
jgi:curved DNA-binding protein CbpA